MLLDFLHGVVPAVSNKWFLLSTAHIYEFMILFLFSLVSLLNARSSLGCCGPAVISSSGGSALMVAGISKAFLSARKYL